MLGPHLTAENVADVLGRAKFRTKKELARLVRELHPLPLVPDVIEPLRPELTPARNPTWQQFVSSLTPAVRELPPGERPRDWASDADDVEGVDGADGGSKSGDAVELVSSESSVPALARVGPVRAELRPITGPQQYQMQFSTSEEHVLLVERAKALLARAAPGKSLGEIHLQAMRLLVAALEKQKFAVTERPKSSQKSHVDGRLTANETAATAVELRQGKVAPAVAKVIPPSRHPEVSAPAAESAAAPLQTRQRGRHIPAAVRRAVFERDGARCTYVDDRGERCREMQCLELHHRLPFGKQGPHTPTNLTLHCPAHNALAAELDFGREHMAEKRDSSRYESLAYENRARECVRLAPEREVKPAAPKLQRGRLASIATHFPNPRRVAELGCHGTPPNRSDCLGVRRCKRHSRVPESQFSGNHSRDNRVRATIPRELGLNTQAVCPQPAKMCLSYSALAGNENAATQLMA
jgi:hypothetical protein